VPPYTVSSPSSPEFEREGSGRLGANKLGRQSTLDYIGESVIVGEVWWRMLGGVGVNGYCAVIRGGR